MQRNDNSGSIAVLLSTLNGEAFLQEQLDSLLSQTHGDWILFWRDDGSDDATCAIMQHFAAGPGAGRCVAVPLVAGRLGVTASYLCLLRAAAKCGSPFAAVSFADQDDVWLPEKLARGLAALRQEADEQPVLYCARQILVDADLRKIAESFRLREPPGFPAALTQNVATGCTVMLNPAAIRLLAASRAPSATLHDWWCYLVVTAAGGRMIIDPIPVILYRQHPGNVVGAPCTTARRAVAALRRGPGLFMAMLRTHVVALRAQPHLLSDRAQLELTRIHRALDSTAFGRFPCLALPGLRRQTAVETLLFRLWFLIG